MIELWDYQRNAEKIRLSAKTQFEKADHIISSLPLSMFSLELKEDILQNATQFLDDKGQFLQFQYAPFDYKRLKKHFVKVKMNFSIRNFPLPLFIGVRYRFRRTNDPIFTQRQYLKLHPIKSF